MTTFHSPINSHPMLPPPDPFARIGKAQPHPPRYFIGKGTCDDVQQQAAEWIWAHFRPEVGLGDVRTATLAIVVNNCDIPRLLDITFGRDGWWIEARAVRNAIHLCKGRESSENFVHTDLVACYTFAALKAERMDDEPTMSVEHGEARIQAERERVFGEGAR